MSALADILGRIRKSALLTHETKKSALLKFLLAALIVFAYFAWMAGEYGPGQGLLITLLTWSFFVFCTPVADAGFLLDFPLRILTGIRMLYSEVGVWVLAAIINIYALSFDPQAYDMTFILQIFRQILLNPVPYWAIIVLAAAGTFLSVYFGDEVMDVMHHHERKKQLAHQGKHLTLLVVFVVLTIILYGILLQDLGLSF
jgi:AcrR family transcriptional regulator